MWPCSSHGGGRCGPWPAWAIPPAPWPPAHDGCPRTRAPLQRLVESAPVQHRPHPRPPGEGSTGRPHTVERWLVIKSFKATWSVRGFLLQNHVVRYKLYRLSKDGLKIDAVRALTLCTHRLRGIFETVEGMAKSPEGNA